MQLHGLQKMTLLDFPGHVACTVFLGGCDFRCPFCHNYELVDGTAKPEMTDDEFFSFLDKRHGLLDGVAVTGGEPLLHPGLIPFLRRIREQGFAVKVDTNGYHPDRLREILDANLADYVAMDVKNSPEKYARTCGLPHLDLEPVLDSIRLLMSSGTEYEFRTTVIAEFHTARDIASIGELIRGAKRYYIQCFTDRDSVPFGDLHAPSRADLDEFLTVAKTYVPAAELRGVD